MDRNVLNDIVNILCANIEKVHGVIITNGGVITNAYGMNKYEYLDRIVFSQPGDYKIHTDETGRNS